MARQKLPDPPGDDVPAWVMTFSDVITLLMTFFILLLTFATNQTETFDRIQVAMFGGGGSPGFVSESDGMVKDSLMMRERARSGRTSVEGSEMPPIYSDPAYESLANSIAGLEESEERVLSTTHRIEQPLSMIVDDEGKLTSRGRQQLKMLATQMRRRPIHVDLVVHSQDEQSIGLTLVEHLTTSESVGHADVGLGISANHVPSGHLLMVVSSKGASRGSEN